MSWAPETPEIPLAVNVKAGALEETTAQIWYEFLRGYFDGESHFGYEFPLAKDVIFQQNAPTQEIEGLVLHIVSVLDGVSRTRRYGDGKFVIVDVMKWEIFCKAKFTTPPTTGETADSLSRRASDMIYGLVRRYAEMRPLYRTGIINVRSSPPKLLPSTAYYTRQLLITAKLKAAI
jgi:hypothetical protein